MYTFLIVLIAVLAVFMVIVVLLQSGKGGGLAGIASGGATTQLLGTRQAPDVLEKATWWLASIFILLCIATTFFTPGGADIDIIRGPQQTQTAPATLPGTGDAVVPPADAQTAPAGEPAATPPPTGETPATQSQPPATIDGTQGGQ